MFTANKPNCGEVLVTYKTTIPHKDFRKITVSSHANDYLREKMFDPDMISFREEMALLMLNRSNNVIGWCRLSIGGISSTTCDPKVVFFHALHCGASNIILAHNHPSGNLKPSKDDIELTNKIKKGCEFFDIRLLDHIILTNESFMSFSDEGLI